MQMPKRSIKPCEYCVKDEAECTCGCVAWERWFKAEWKKVTLPLREYFDVKRKNRK